MDRLGKISATLSMEISAEKTKLMTDNANGISIDIRSNGEKLYKVDSFKYLGTVVKDWSITEQRALLFFCKEEKATKDKNRQKQRWFQFWPLKPQSLQCIFKIERLVEKFKLY